MMHNFQVLSSSYTYALSSMKSEAIAKNEVLLSFSPEELLLSTCVFSLEYAEFY